MVSASSVRPRSAKTSRSTCLTGSRLTGIEFDPTDRAVGGAHPHADHGSELLIYLMLLMHVGGADIACPASGDRMAKLRWKRCSELASQMPKPVPPDFE